MSKFRFLSCILILAVVLSWSSAVRAVILLSTGDPTVNTSEPTGVLAGSGWQYEGSFGWFLGTAIGPHYFITVKHIGIASNVFVYQGVSYTVVQWFDDPISELRIFEVAEAMPTYAPLYAGVDELNRDIVVIGRGTQRGNPVYLGGTLRGWQWGVGDGVQRWGENQVAAVNGNSLYAIFDQNGGSNEAQLSSGDSGGATFMNDAGVWKLAGINYAIDDAVSSAPTSASFEAALFDARGFYDSSQKLISGSGPIPTGFYALRISQRLAWIQGVIAPGTPSPTPAPSPTATPSATPATTPSPTPPPTGAAQMLSPGPGSTFASSTMTFVWSPGSANKYSIFVGNSVGGSDIYNSGNLSVRSVTVRNIPTNGEVIHVRLRSHINRKWESVDYVYSAYSYDPSPTPTPAPSATPAPTPAPTPSATPPRQR